MLRFETTVTYLVAVSEDIGSLQGLVLEAKDVVDDQDGLLCIARPSGICLHAINGRVFALGIVAFADDGRNGTASVGLHCGFVSDLNRWFECCCDGSCCAGGIAEGKS